METSRSLVAPQLIGYGATAHLESGGFIRSRQHVAHPDIQFHFLPSQVIDHGRVASRAEAYQVCVATFRMYRNCSLSREVCVHMSASVYSHTAVATDAKNDSIT